MTSFTLVADMPLRQLTLTLTLTIWIPYSYRRLGDLVVPWEVLCRPVQILTEETRP